MESINIVLNQPEIPGNTGSIGRTCVALNARLILIKPYGFDLDEKSIRRAGLDYWKYVELTEYDSFDEFIEKENPQKGKLFFFSKIGKESYFDAKFVEGSYLIFGPETKGLPLDLFDKYSGHFYSIPMFSSKIRSLNLANAATAAAYEVVRQLGAHKV
ncbi:MAG: tRNA (cytidine(34)-2'-O)-methyltransferase [Halobacteriovoraceae bacterium]|nr:tRNA (cytidine(34)-2'-O)-methyltransferase [Halobacteriovoraceae bacterium]